MTDLKIVIGDDDSCLGVARLRRAVVVQPGIAARQLGRLVEGNASEHAYSGAVRIRLRN